MTFIGLSDRIPDANRRRAILTKESQRILMYVGLLLCDCAAVRAGFSIGGSVRGAEWLNPNGIELGWLVLPLHIAVCLRNGGYSRQSLTSASESVRRGGGALLMSSALICMLLFFQYAGPLVSRVAFGVAILSSLTALAVLRLIFIGLFVSGRRDGMVGVLMIVDGRSSLNPHGDRIDAQAEGLVPDLRDPMMLAKLSTLVGGYDRVLISCTDDRRHAWSMLLKAYNVTGEVLVNEGAPLGAIGVDRFNGQDTMIVSRGPLSLSNRVKKRAMDIVVSAAALFVLAPLLLVTAIAIKLDSRGPVFFAQPRVGQSNRLFKILKFRSMRAERTDIDGAQSTRADDDRVTRVGRFIRKTSIDELPQLVNVLKGEMSIVGPRPHALGSLAGDKLFWEVTERYWLRHALKPGITGLAQVRGLRGATHEQSDLENRLQADLEYIDGWRLWRDVTIMIGTAGVLLHPRAY